jgi:translation initiation factor 2A
MLAGFGNLRGEVQFWDRKTLKMINLLNAEDTTAFEWCPDSEHLVTASCSPRLKVDNGFKIWHYTRGLVYKTEIKELWSVTWRPVPEGTFPLKPIARVSAKAKASAAAPKSVYRPPGARGTESTLKLHENLPAENAGDATADEPLSKSAMKNKKKREAKRLAAEKAAFVGTGVATKKKTAEQLAAVAMIVEHEAHHVAKAKAADPDEPVKELEKKIRNLAKKMRQIDALVQKQEAGEFLQENQKEKVVEKPRVQAEIDELNARLATLKV